MAPAVLEREIAKLDATQQNAVVLFIRFLASQPKHDAINGINTADDPVIGRQKREMESLIGSWNDARSAEEIIADVLSARTTGRRWRME